MAGQIFNSFFQAGFDCSSQRRSDGVRLDLIRATAHDLHALGDYRLCKQLGLGTIRDGLRWHLIEIARGKYDWSSWTPMLEAAEEAGVEIIWDLFHYGSPDHVDQAGSDFPERFAEFAIAATELQQSISSRPPFVCPLNEISFICWASHVGYFPRIGPKERGWLKHHLVRTAIVAARALRERWPDATIVWAEPLIHIAPHGQSEEEARVAETYRQEQFEAYDWITGIANQDLGGEQSLADVIGLNFYPHNQWYYEGSTIPMGHHEYRSLSDMLAEVAERYRKPMFLSETGAEGSGRASWLHYVCNEVRDATSRGAQVEAICWYPITAYPGWDNSRHAEAGLLSSITSEGTRHVDGALFNEFEEQRVLFACSPEARPSVAGGGRY